jgi:hypothetical protein
MVQMGWRLLLLSIVAALPGVQAALAQTSYPCVNDAPDPYQRGVSFAPLPDGRRWGSTAGVAVAPDGTIWAYDRCGANSCAGSSLDPIVALSTVPRSGRRI